MFANRKILLLLVSLLILAAFPTSLLASPVASLEIYRGSGTKNDPYLIYSENDLRKIGNDPDWALDKSYKLMSNITLEKPDEGKSNWIPIGDNGNPFQGNFDGNHHTIKNMTITAYDANYIGFFGMVNNVSGSKIENLGLVDINIDVKGRSSIGGLVGGAYINIIRNCFVTGVIQSSDNSKFCIGGIAGIITGTVEGCYSDVNLYIKGTGNSVGGIAGFLVQGKIKKSYSTGYIYGNQAGGIAGLTLAETTIENCYSLSIIEPCSGSVLLYIDSVIGGIVGLSGKTTIKNCYFAGSLIINGGTASGGIVGGATDKTSIQSSLVLADNIINKNISSSYISSIGYLAYPDDQRKMVTSENNYIIKDIYFNLPESVDKDLYLSNLSDFNVKLISKINVTNKYFYESIGWNFAENNPTWEFTKGYALPKLVDVGGQENLVTPKHLL